MLLKQRRGMQLIGTSRNIVVGVDVFSTKRGGQGQVGSQSVVDEGMGRVVFRNGIIEL